jgi:putative DNA primase/helicase
VQRFANPFRRQNLEYFGPASQLAAQLGGTGEPNVSGWYSCKCPAHGDERASLSLRHTPDGGLVAKCFKGCTGAEIRAALREMKAAGGFTKPSSPPPGTVEWTANDSLRTAAAIWHMSFRHDDENAALLRRYMREHRKISIWLPRALRFHPRLYHAESGICGPGMVALVRDAHGEKCGIHRTWIDRVTGGKTTLDPPRKSLCPTMGRSVHLDCEPYDVVGVAEGVETAVSFMEYCGGYCPTWAALSAPGLASLIVPDRIRKVVIACDNDKAGIEAADRLTTRLTRQTPPVSVERVFPPDGHNDFNDWLRAKRA